MKNLQEKISEGLIIEGAAKNVHNPRKGSTIYLLKDGEEKIVKATVTDVKKVKIPQGGRYNSFYIYIYLSDNEYKIDSYMEYHFGSIEYKDEDEQVQVHSFGDEIGNVYIGTSKEVIQGLINSTGKKALDNILKQIEQKEAELEELMQKKQKAEREANLEINESLNK